MKRLTVVPYLLLGACLALLTATAVAAGWAIYEAKAYGFSMLIPSGTPVKEREWPGGWGGLTAQHDGVNLFGLAKLGAQPTDAEIEKFAVQTIGIPASEWTKVDQGRNSNGWNRYRTFEATKGAKLVFGAYGVGSKGAYLLYLETTPADFNAYRADYNAWYNSIRLH